MVDFDENGNFVDPPEYISRVYTLPWYDRLYLWTRTKILSDSLEQAMVTNTCKYLRTFIILAFLAFILVFTVSFIALLIGVILFKMIMATWSWSAFLAVLSSIVFAFVCVIGIAIVCCVVGAVIIYFADKAAEKGFTVNLPKFKKWTWSWPESRLLNTIAKCMRDMHDKICTPFKVGHDV